MSVDGDSMWRQAGSPEPTEKVAEMLVTIDMNGISKVGVQESGRIRMCRHRWINMGTRRPA